MKKKSGCLGFIGDYTTQLWGDDNKPFFRIPVHRPGKRKVRGIFFRGSIPIWQAMSNDRSDEDSQPVPPTEKKIKVDQVILLMEGILHQLVGSSSHYLQGYIEGRWCWISSINSMRCSDAVCFCGKLLISRRLLSRWWWVEAVWIIFHVFVGPKQIHKPQTPKQAVLNYCIARQIPAISNENR